MIKLKLKPEPKEELDVQFIDRDRLVAVSLKGSIIVDDISAFEGRTAGKFAGHALYLPYDFDYVLGEDEDGAKILIPLTPKD